MKTCIFAILTTIFTTFGASAASAQTALRDVPYVRDNIIYVGMAYELSEECDDLNARVLRGISFLYSLQRHAADLGYSDAEIDDYINDDDEKKRLERIARAQLADLGVVEGEEDTYCSVGRAQMEANTRIGWLLR